MTLRRGDKGQQVMVLQGALQKAGIGLPVYGVDGIFGPETESAVKQAQRLFLMDPTGIAGQPLFNVLDIEAISSSTRQSEKSSMTGMTHWIMAGLLVGSLAFAAQKMRK